MYKSFPHPNNFASYAIIFAGLFCIVSDFDVLDEDAMYNSDDEFELL